MVRTRYWKFKSKLGEGVIGAKYKRKPHFPKSKHKIELTPITKERAKTMVKKSKYKSRQTKSGKTGVLYTRLRRKK
jgi:hypothetical protein